jgi:diguanylate cyclase (GGDEF)-like protein/PAS domain S-box-containing protein
MGSTEITTSDTTPRVKSRAQPDLARLIHNLPGIAYHCEWNGTWKMNFLSKACSTITGYAPSDLISEGKLDWSELIHPEDLVQVRHQIDTAVLAGSTFQVFYRARRSNGVERWMMEDGRASEITDDGKVFLEGFVTDVTEFKQAQDSIQDANRTIDRLTREDPLTGLANRRALDQTIVRSISFAHRWKYPLAVVMADVDHFKRVNDTYGHLVGDQVLISFSQILKASCRVEDLAVRFGGEEFLLLLPSANAEQAAALATRIQLELKQETLPVPSPVTVSFGVTSLGENDTPDSLIERADKALYVAKRSGRDRVEIMMPDRKAEGERSSDASE